MGEKTQKWTTIVLQDIVLAIVINTTATLLSGHFPGVLNYLIGCLEAFSINILAGMILPVDLIGTKFANWVQKKFAITKIHFLKIFAINAIFVTIISFSMALIHNGFVSNIISIWMDTYIILHLVGLIASLISGPIVEKQVANWFQTQNSIR